MDLVIPYGLSVAARFDQSNICRSCLQIGARNNSFFVFFFVLFQELYVQVFDSLERPLNENMNEMQMDCFEGGVNASKRCLQSA